jgi:hypothetical protein
MTKKNTPDEYVVFPGPGPEQDRTARYVDASQYMPEDLADWTPEASKKATIKALGGRGAFIASNFTPMIPNVQMTPEEVKEFDERNKKAMKRVLKELGLKDGA